jgi:hypothetical protein
MPFYHPQRGVWVEVHRRLFSGHRGVATDKVFSLEHVKHQRRLSEFRGRQVYRLSNEFQIVYISAHWGSGSTIIDGMIAMLDIIYLLRNAREHLRWDLILHWLRGSTAALYLSLILTYLQQHHLIDIAPEIPKTLRADQTGIMRSNIKLLHIIMDYYVVAGKDFGPYCTAEDVNHVWRTLLSSGSPLQNLILVMRHFLRLRTRLYRLKRIVQSGR